MLDGCEFLLSNDFVDLASFDTSGGCEKEGGRKDGKKKKKNRFEVGLIAEQIHGGR